jgi:hypothetical protein
MHSYFIIRAWYYNFVKNDISYQNRIPGRKLG